MKGDIGIFWWKYKSIDLLNVFLLKYVPGKGIKEYVGLTLEQNAARASRIYLFFCCFIILRELLTNDLYSLVSINLDPLTLFENAYNSSFSAFAVTIEFA